MTDAIQVDEEFERVEREKAEDTKRERAIMRRDRCLQLALAAKGEKNWSPGKIDYCARLFWRFTEGMEGER